MVLTNFISILYNSLISLIDLTTLSFSNTIKNEMPDSPQLKEYPNQYTGNKVGYVPIVN